MQELEEEGDGAAPGGEEGMEEDEDVPPASEGPTFAERLAALQLQEGGAGAGAGAGAGRQGKRGGGAAPPTGPLKADSLSVLLGQALQSGDRALLERCLTGGVVPACLPACLVFFGEVCVGGCLQYSA